MIGHVAEVWLALFAAFAVGSLLGWLIYRWIDRSDYSFGQREFTEAGARRTTTQGQAMAKGATALRPAGGRNPERARPGGAAPVPRRGIQPEPVKAAAPQTAAVRPAGSTPGAAGGGPPLRGRSQVPPAVTPGRQAPADRDRQQSLPRPQTPRGNPAAAAFLRRRSAADSGAAPAARAPEPPKAVAPLRPPAPPTGEPWPAQAESWPIERASEPAGARSEGSKADEAGRATVLTEHPSHDEIWADEASEKPDGGRTEGSAGDHSGTVWADIVGEEDAEILAGLEEGEESFAARIDDEDSKDEPATDGPRLDEREGVRPPTLAMRPARPSDLKRIKGIGPAFEKQLNELGIYHYSQIAKWSLAEQHWVGEEFGFVGRIERDDWVGQATELAREEEAKAADHAPG